MQVPIYVALIQLSTKLSELTEQNSAVLLEQSLGDQKVKKALEEVEELQKLLKEEREQKKTQVEMLEDKLCKLQEASLHEQEKKSEGE